MQASFSRIASPSRLAVLWQFMRFGTVGFAGFLVDNAVVYGLRAWLGLYASGALSFLVAATVTWALNRAWTFRGLSSGPAHRQWAIFLATNAIGFVFNRGTYFLLIWQSALCRQHPVVAIFAGTLAGMFLNFYFSRKVVFR